MLYNHRPMPQDRDKQRGKAIVVDGETPGHSGSQSSAPRKLTAVACVDCRKRKRKCNGERPSCSACQTRGLSCMYDVVEGATRTEDLKQKVVTLSSRVRNLELFINKLRYSTDNEASAILAQLRLGDTVDEILGVDMVEGLSEMSEVDQWKDQAIPTLKSVSTFGIGLARNPTGPSLLTSIPLYDPTRSERSTSVVTNSPGVVDGLGPETSQPRQEQIESPWARSLFTQVHAQHLLFEEDPYSGVQGAAHESFPILDGDAPNSVYLMGDHKRLWIDPTLSASTPGMPSGPGSAALERHTKILDKYRARRRLLNEARPGGDCVMITSHLFSTGGAFPPLSSPMNPQLLGMPEVTAPAWSIMSMYRNDDPDLMSVVYVDFILESKRLIASGIPPERLFGTVPDVEVLVNEAEFVGAPVLSQWTARLANSFGIQSLVCRMAVMYIQWYLMRWIILQTPETYLAIPDWYRPTPYQMFVPHPIYADFHVWPRLRDAVIQRIDLQCQATYWYSEAATTIDCNWPGNVQDAMCYDGNRKLRLAPAFVKHILDLGNWTIGPVIRKHIPDACTVLQIKYGPM
ncbi:hypothetical protein D6D19_06952 [Aureobasidium pullulans]|uniref:Zn(2)-C6 fungal-type domain-containing protein n=1 Tax=Aureobasidium pullulans TaxID=5580 RepID=A0A4S8ZZA0_AURPU|nr:hypothetical protein D6D19_06952 [Aureobasidium pullulans]